MPTRQERELCSIWREQELRLLEPELIVTVGGLALRSLFGPSDLTACIGRRLEHAGVPVIPLPHPSGASGWLNMPTNRAKLEQALALLRSAL